MESFFSIHKYKLWIISNWFRAKNYFNITKIFLLRLFKNMSNQTECSRLEQRSVIKFLVAEKCKPCEIYRRIYDVYTKKHV